MTIRMPRELHEVVRDLAYDFRVSVNQVMLETLVNNVAEIRLDPENPREGYISDNPYYSQLLNASQEQITNQFLKEFDFERNVVLNNGTQTVLSFQRMRAKWGKDNIA